MDLTIQILLVTVSPAVRRNRLQARVRPNAEFTPCFAKMLHKRENG
ncbi:hypothetical protein H3M12_05470 [Levilactobacillus suantsaii]|nr:hypothetical protein H3M12_05470 [Levilactobacillus suantsaii]